MTSRGVDLEQLQVRAELGDALATFCERLDEYRVSEALAVFSEDCVTDYGPGAGGPLEGRAAFQQRVEASHARFVRTHHQLGQTSYVIDGDVAETVSYVTAWHEYPDGRQDTVWLRYVDRWKHGPEGWRIERREALTSGVDGFPGREWRFVPRR